MNHDAPSRDSLRLCRVEVSGLAALVVVNDLAVVRRRGIDVGNLDTEQGIGSANIGFATEILSVICICVTNLYLVVPLKSTVCGLPPPSSSNAKVALLAPVDVGRSVKVTIQPDPGTSVAGQLFDCENSAALIPVIDIFARLTGTLPLTLVTVRIFCLLLPIETLPKLSLLLDSWTIVPVPVNETVCVPTLSMITSEPVRVFGAVGLKTTFATQLALTARVVPQL